MRAVFADTFYWIALTNVQDLAHEKAKALTLSLRPRIVFTIEEVLPLPSGLHSRARRQSLL